MLIVDVGPRDGLQNEPDVLAPEIRAELVGRLVGAGIRAVEVASFVDPRRVPQMAGAEELVATVDRVDGVVYAGLALNERGYDRLVASGLESPSAPRSRSTNGIRTHRCESRCRRRCESSSALEPTRSGPR